MCLAQVLLYLTPLHCQDMLDSVVTSLNATVAKFTARNPSFKVTVWCQHNQVLDCLVLQFGLRSQRYVQQDSYRPSTILDKIRIVIICSCFPCVGAGRHQHCGALAWQRADVGHPVVPAAALLNSAGMAGHQRRS